MRARPEIQAAIEAARQRGQRHITSRVLPSARDCWPDKTKRPLCRWCGRAVPKGRRTWCSKECVHEYRVRADAGYVALLLKRRDKGVCCSCGIDTEEIWTLMRACRRRGAHPRWDSPEREEFVTQWGPWGCDTTRRLWEADHIVPVSEGGGCCGLDNYRTLCLACHKAETAALAARTAEARRRLGCQPVGLGPNIPTGLTTVQSA